MGRKSLAPIRRGEILDAFEKCVREQGIAAAAGMQPATIQHYFGTRKSLIEAVTDRLDERFRRAYVESVIDAPESSRLNALLNFLFDGDYAALGPTNPVYISLLVETSTEKDAAALLLKDSISALLELIQKELARTASGAEDDMIAATAHAILCLADTTATMRSVGLGAETISHARGTAEKLINSMNNGHD